MSEDPNKKLLQKKERGRGRPVGSPNRRSYDVAARLAELGCDPLESMARLAKESEASGDMALAGSMYKELAQYVAPKRKAVEVTGENGGSVAMAMQVSVNVNILPT